MVIVVASSGRLGRLWKNGTRRVRITNTTSDCVASDSANQPFRKRGAWAWKTQSITAKVRKLIASVDPARPVARVI
jgi:hypothetical protein